MGSDIGRLMEDVWEERVGGQRGRNGVKEYGKGGGTSEDDE